MYEYTILDVFDYPCKYFLTSTFVILVYQHKRYSKMFELSSQHHRAEKRNKHYVVQLFLSRLFALFMLIIRRCYIHLEAAKTEFSRKIIASLYFHICSQRCPHFPGRARGNIISLTELRARKEGRREIDGEPRTS